MFQRYLQQNWFLTALILFSLMVPAQAQNIIDAPNTMDGTEKTINEYVPQKNEINIVLKVSERRAYLYRGQKLLKKIPVAVGKKGWETPTGDWKVQLMKKNPGWLSFKTGEAFPPGKDNPLGERWIGFWYDEKSGDQIGFHGTSNLKSIGQAASHGCVRMSNKDVKMLYKLVQVGTVVRVRA